MALDDDVREALGDLIDEHGSELVYARGDRSFKFRGYVSRQQPTTFETDAGGYIEVMIVDVLTLTSSLNDFEPQQGDRIERDGEIFEVQSFPGQKAFRVISPSMTRIHTKQI